MEGKFIALNEGVDMSSAPNKHWVKHRDRLRRAAEKLMLGTYNVEDFLSACANHTPENGMHKICICPVQVPTEALIILCTPRISLYFCSYLCEK